MFSKLAFLVAATMAVFVAAVPSGGIEHSCNTGPVQCCNSIYSHDSEQVEYFKSLLNIVVPVGATVATQCSPISVIGLGEGSSCASQPVCCENNDFNGVVAIGCSPVGATI